MRKFKGKTNWFFLKKSETQVNTVNLFVYLGVAFVVTVFLGLWLSRLGKPYHGILFNIHKLIALAAVVLIGLEFSNRFKMGNVESESILQVIVIALMVVSLVASGALMSLDKLNYKMLRWMHRIAPLVLVFLGIWMIVKG